MSVYITNITKNIHIGVGHRTLKPGIGDTFSDEVAEQPGVIAYVKKGWLKSEMIKEVPDAVSVGEVKKAPKKEVKIPDPVKATPKAEVKSPEPVGVAPKAPVDATPKAEVKNPEPASVTPKSPVDATPKAEAKSQKS